jgi:hypothetical protein
VDTAATGPMTKTVVKAGKALVYVNRKPFWARFGPHLWQASARLILGEEIALAWVHDFNLNTFDL